MAEQYLPNLGQLCKEGARRDAVHIAVAPVLAGQELHAGDHVKLAKDGKGIRGSREDCVGVVDPFLAEAVAKDQQFWLFLYPNTVTSLRHVWTHPAFVPLDRRVP